MMAAGSVFRGAILLYHRVSGEQPDPYGLCVDPIAFAQQMDVVRKRCSPLTLEDLVASSRSGGRLNRPLAITFDDGYVDNLTVASPILSESKLPATFFVTTEDLLDPRPYWWDLLAVAQPADAPQLHDQLVHASLEQRHQLLQGLLPERKALASMEVPRPMSGDELRTLASRPGHSIGVHTTHHLFLPSQPAVVAEREMRDCKTALEGVLNRPIRAIAYPFGGTTPEIASVAAAIGFESGLTVERDVVRQDSDIMQLPRIEITRDTDFEAVLDELFAQAQAR